MLQVLKKYKDEQNKTDMENIYKTGAESTLVNEQEGYPTQKMVEITTVNIDAALSSIY